MRIFPSKVKTILRTVRIKAGKGLGRVWGTEVKESTYFLLQSLS